MRCAHQREQLAVEIKPGPQHADSLERLVGAPRIHRREVSADRVGQAAVRVRDHHPAAVHALDESAADDLDQDRVGLERASHVLTLYRLRSERAVQG